MLKEIFKNKSLPFLLIRYVTYVFAFLKINLLASKLGSHTYGNWEFIKLVWQYLSFLTLGIHFSINVLIASNKDDFNKIKKLSNVALSAVIVVFFIILIGAILEVVFNIVPLEKYDIGHLLIAAVAIGMLKNINLVNLNISRNFDRLYTIGTYYFVSEFLIILLVKVLAGKWLLDYVIYSILVIELIFLFIFIINRNFSFKFSFYLGTLKELVQRGVKLLMYNYSLVFMFLSVRSVVAYYYNIEEFGEYSFANSLVDSLFVAFTSVVWIFFPKMITKLSSANEDEATNMVQKIRDIYMPLMFLSILLLGYAAFFMRYLFPDYLLFKEIFIIMLLSLGLRDYSFGYNTVIIAKGKEIILAKYAIIAIVLNFCFSIYLGNKGASLHYIPLMTLVASFLYSMSAIYASRKIIGKYSPFRLLLKDWKVFVPLLLFILFYIGNWYSIFTYSFVVILFIGLNAKGLYASVYNALKVFTKGKI